MKVPGDVLTASLAGLVVVSLATCVKAWVPQPPARHGGHRNIAATAATATAASSSSRSSPPSDEDFETLVRADDGAIEGVHAAPGSALVQRVLARVPELASWDRWYDAPRALRGNGHAHTIWAAKARRTRACRYHRVLLPTADGGTLALDLLAGISRAPVAGNDAATSFTPTTPLPLAPPPTPPKGGGAVSPRPFLLLISGLGGGSQDSYVRSMAARAATRGWAVGVLNMRSCGGSAVSSPRFFSAHRGATDDVRVALRHVRAAALVDPAAPIALLGWSNGQCRVLFLHACPVGDAMFTVGSR